MGPLFFSKQSRAYGERVEVVKTVAVGSQATEAFDDYDTAKEWDLVWRNTSITSGMQAFSLAKPYFPKGKARVAKGHGKHQKLTVQ